MRCGDGTWFAGSELAALDDTDASCTVVRGRAARAIVQKNAAEHGGGPSAPLLAARCFPCRWLSPPPHASLPTFCPLPTTTPTPPRCPPARTTPIAPAASPAPAAPDAGVNGDTIASPGVRTGRPMYPHACCRGAQLLARATIRVGDGCASTPACPLRVPPPSARPGACPRRLHAVHPLFAHPPSARQAFPGHPGVFPHVEPAPTRLAARLLARPCTRPHAPRRIPKRASGSFSP
ncbi:hypothetical protein OBBRIDRAFT_834187 [Obba rivulosa]|uniref:Uncharacterized protein n=1 Tax=Obba rivulosa TaxID=1052685 RepID=A0A8E2B056_9APHY|nr:hypothetical protein OBBRIDRAFT_834187 [Obba rivulosa]